MTPRSRLAQLVEGLINAADEPHDLRLAVAYSADGSELDMLAPPQQLATSSEVFAAEVLGQLLDRFGSGGLSTVGALVPAAVDVDGLRVVRPQLSDGMLVCAAERGIGGTASAAMFRPHGETSWSDVHSDADWICAALRALVAGGALEDSEAGTMPSSSWESKRTLDDLEQS